MKSGSYFSANILIALFRSSVVTKTPCMDGKGMKKVRVKGKGGRGGHEKKTEENNKRGKVRQHLNTRSLYSNLETSSPTICFDFSPRMDTTSVVEC